MNTSKFKAFAQQVTFDEDLMWVLLSDGRKLGVPLAYFPRLSKATNDQRENFELSGGGTGIHWDDIDEDISVNGLLLGIGDKTAQDAEAA